MGKILLVEDSEEVQIIVRGVLGRHHEVSIASTVSEATLLLEKTLFDLVLLDIGLDDGNGFQICTQMRNVDTTLETPIIFLTAKTQIKDKLMAFSLGADDYLVKPFEPLELRARVEAKLKSHSSRYLEILTKGQIKLNFAYQKAFLTGGKADVPLDLSPNEFRLLSYLVKNEGRVLSREQILHSVWGQNANVTYRTVDTHIYTLRKKLETCADYIKSIFGEGYRFSSSNPSSSL